MAREEAIKKLADIIFDAAKSGYMPYDTDYEMCAMNMAKKHIDDFYTSLPSDLDEAAEKYADIQNKNFLKPEIVKNIFKVGAKWMATQGDAIATRLVIDSEGKVNLNFAIGDITDENCNPKYHAGQDVIVQIREITQRKA